MSTVDSLKGQLLLASPALFDPNFRPALPDTPEAAENREALARYTQGVALLDG